MSDDAPQTEEAGPAAPAGPAGPRGRRRSWALVAGAVAVVTVVVLAWVLGRGGATRAMVGARSGSATVPTHVGVPFAPAGPALPGGPDGLPYGGVIVDGEASRSWARSSPRRARPMTSPWARPPRRSRTAAS